MPYKDEVKQRESNRRAQKKRRANPESKEDVRRTEWLRHKKSRATRNRKSESFNRKTGHLPRLKGKRARLRINVPEEKIAVLEPLGPTNKSYIYFSQECEFTWTGFEEVVKRLLPDIASNVLQAESMPHTSHGRKWQFWSNNNGEPCFVVSRNNGIGLDDLHKLTAEFKGYIAAHSNRSPILKAEDGWDGADIRALSEQLEILEAGDSREFIQTSIKLRRGQCAFRQRVLRKHGGKCLITGCNVKDVLEAAHIKSYRGPLDHNIKNALLLRADVHTLYDLNLVAIDPQTLRVHIHPSLTGSSYAEFHVAPLLVPQGFSFIESALEGRWIQFQECINRLKKGAKSEGVVEADTAR
ncbi:MAG TPA: hypothetical protein DDZ88_08370 [Verrucomicrobiales bacterium]|nr:hypothetical protein [Verrucomicrobiales bacterium]